MREQNRVGPICTDYELVRLRETWLCNVLQSINQSINQTLFQYQEHRHSIKTHQKVKQNDIEDIIKRPKRPEVMIPWKQIKLLK